MSFPTNLAEELVTRSVVLMPGGYEVIKTTGTWPAERIAVESGVGRTEVAVRAAQEAQVVVAAKRTKFADRWWFPK